jgi:hypothetical protein
VAGGKLWTDEESKLLKEMLTEDISFEDICKSDKFLDRTPDAIKSQIRRLRSGFAERHLSFVERIEPASEPLTIEKVVKLFSTAFEQICSTNQVEKLSLERFRVIFQAAKDYGPLLAGYEKWDTIEKRIDDLEANLAELQEARKAKES